MLHNLSQPIQSEEAKLQGQWSGSVLIEVDAISCDSGDTYASSDGTTCLFSWCDAGWELHSSLTSCVECQPGRFSTDQATTCAACEPGTFCSETQCSACMECPDGQVSSNEGAEVCLDCTDNTVPSTNRSECQCDEDWVNSTALVVHCFVNDFENRLTATNADGCTDCPPCVDCSSPAEGIFLRRGYRLFAPQARVNGTQLELHAFSCDLEGSCPRQLLTTSTELALAEFHTNLQPQPCTVGHHGVLCALCEDGWSHARQELCTECSTSSVWWVWGGAFAVVGAVGVYFAAQVSELLLVTT